MHSWRKQCGFPEGLAFCLSTRESAETVSGFLAAVQGYEADEHGGSYCYPVASEALMSV